MRELRGTHRREVHPRRDRGSSRRLDTLIRQALSFDDEDAYSAGESGFLARALVQATLPNSDPKANEFVRHNGQPLASGQDV